MLSKRQDCERLRVLRAFVAALDSIQEIPMSHASTVAKSAVSTMVAAICLSMPTVWAQQSAGRSQANPAYRSPRAADGHADLNGIWQAMNTANWDLQDHPARRGPVVA